ncbi:hypothetical protein LTR42_005580 [Elasticomyces elasticus]|nr:hypothetical protein LTR42_005580 [Elasticomyces elasticus]
MSSQEPWLLTAAEVLPLLREDKLTVTDYVKSLLERVQARDPEVKAWAWIEPSLILQQAKELDGLSVSERGPLSGLPIAVKDVILTKDMPTQYNSRLYESETPIGIDANCIITLRAQGALILGKTSTTEFASSKQVIWHQNLRGTLATRNVPIALGTQTGGSIVRPASFDGCYGFKPTTVLYRVKAWRSGVHLLADTFRLKDNEVASSKSSSKSSSLQGAKIGFCKTHNWSKAGQGTIDAMAKAQNILTTHGGQVEDVELPNEFSRVLDWHADVLVGEGQTSFLGQYLLDKDKLHESI